MPNGITVLDEFGLPLLLITPLKAGTVEVMVGGKKIRLEPGVAESTAAGLIRMAYFEAAPFNPQPVLTDLQRAARGELEAGELEQLGVTLIRMAYAGLDRPAVVLKQERPGQRRRRRSQP